MQPLPLPADMSKEERELTLKAIQELTREASAFVKGRNAKKMMGYEMGANLNNGKFRLIFVLFLELCSSVHRQAQYLSGSFLRSIQK